MNEQTAGYHCGVCGAWVGWGMSHICPSYMPPQSYTPPYIADPAVIAKLDEIIMLLKEILDNDI